MITMCDDSRRTLALLTRPRAGAPAGEHHGDQADGHECDEHQREPEFIAVEAVAVTGLGERCADEPEHQEQRGHHAGPHSEQSILVDHVMYLPLQSYCRAPAWADATQRTPAR